MRAVREWEKARDANQNGQTPPQDQYPDWWSLSKERAALSKSSPGQNGHGQLQDDHRDACNDLEEWVPSDFVGQGRQIGYNGLAYTVVASVDVTNETDPDQLAAIIDQTKQHINDKPPRSWWIVSLAALALVWWDIGMALMISFNIPTVGIGCRSGSYIVYGLVSTTPWFLHLFAWFRRQGNMAKIAGHLLCGLSTWVLVFIFFAAVSGLDLVHSSRQSVKLMLSHRLQFSGVMKNCVCRGGLSGYLDFESADFYSNPEHFNVKMWWVAAATIGAVPAVVSLLAALILLFMLRPLWQESEPGQNDQGVVLEDVGNGEAKADMTWLD